MFQVLKCLTVEHDWRLVALAGAVCILVSVVAIALFHCAGAARGRSQQVWLALDAAAAGCGIWATHFIAMLAYDPGVNASYDVGFTLLSLIFAVAITGIGVGIAFHDFSKWAAAIGGAVVGGGIAAMHFTGMLALELPGRITWSTGLVLASLVLGAVFGSLALVVAARRDDFWHNGIAAVLFATAIVTLHFTAMGALVFTPDPTRVVGPITVSMSPVSLALVVAGAASIILGMCLVAALSDRRSKEKLRRQELLLDTALENMSQGLCMFDGDGRVLLFNERYAKMMDLPAELLRGRSLMEMLRHRKAAGNLTGDPEEIYESVMSNVRAGKPTSRIVELLASRALRVVTQPMRGGGWVATTEDITEWRKAQAQLSHMAHHDALTNLPNRTKFRMQLEQALRNAKRNDHVAMLCLDLDHFKGINDSLGHPTGDDLLKEVARRLLANVREGDTVSRLGGDEFAIVHLGSELQASEASSLAGRLVEVLSAPYDIQGQQLIIGVSIGISLAPDDGNDPDQLLKNADMALYRAKADGRGTYRFFESGMDARAQARRLLEVDLRAALTRDEFEIHYQPILDLKADRIIAFEALVRWNHPLRGMIPPLNFIPLAEETGLIVPIGEWVLATACADAAGWSQDVGVAVNLSPVQFRSANLVPSVTAALAASGLPAGRLELEITESVLLQDSEVTLATLHKLRGFGVRISMDDFGTGYSSLSYLRSFPFDKIKIDRSFVSELSTREDSIAIIRAVAGLGKSLGISTTAEGIETGDQLMLLRKEGCTEGQGYLFSPPRPAADVEKMLSHGRPRVVA